MKEKNRHLIEQLKKKNQSGQLEIAVFLYYEDVKILKGCLCTCR